MRYLLPRNLYSTSCRQNWDAHSDPVTTFNCWGVSNIPFISLMKSMLVVFCFCFFKRRTSGATNMRQLRSSHSSYDQPYPAVMINDLFPSLTVTINSPKFSPLEIVNIRPCYCWFLRQKKSISPMTLSRCNMDGAVGVDTIQDCLNASCSISTILIDRNCTWL